MDQSYKEVNYNRFCEICEHKDVKETEEPCNECLDNPINLYSEKPVKWVKKGDEK